jgi:peptidoglycan/xylan/chitin deacetylase (PgdA/CDA1 family)
VRGAHGKIGPVPIGRSAALLGAAAWAGPALAPILAPAARLLRIPSRLKDSRTVAVTFDDGPHPEGTPAVLEILASEGVTATFFLVGEQVRRTGTLAREIVAAGHAVAIHGDRHRNLLRLAPRVLADDLDRAADTIATATGVVPVVHRAPYGIYSWPALAEVRRRGWTPLLWSAWGRDWARDATADSVSGLVLRDLDGGGVMLLHDADDYSVPGSWRATAGALPRILEGVAARGLRPVALTDPAAVHVPGR